MRLLLLLIAVAFVGCSRVESSPTAAIGPTYLEACELVRERKAAYDDARELRNLMLGLNPTRAELEECNRVVDEMSREYQYALSLRIRLAPKTKSN
jgi:hypothetical protein